MFHPHPSQEYKIDEYMGKDSMKQSLEEIPGVGKSNAKYLMSIGITSIQDLKNKNPQVLYEKLCRKTGVKQDRCLLYVFRCAVYFASHKTHDTNLLKWWNWKDASSVP